MNQWQLARQIRYLVGKRTWDGTGSAVFGDRSVVISELPLDELAGRVHGNPFAAVRLGSESFDPEWPEIATSITVMVDVCTSVFNDRFGSASLVGGVRTDFTTSRGAGIGELMSEVKAQIKRLETVGGVSILSQITSSAKTVRVGDGFHTAQTITVEANGHADPFYHPTRDLANAAGTLSWTNAPDRFDRVTAVLRYASGSTPPASATAGSGANLSSLATSYAHGDDGQIGGTFSYALFAAYDLNGDGTADKFGAAQTFTGAF